MGELLQHYDRLTLNRKGAKAQRKGAQRKTEE
jgi:hypothetical protein